MTTQASKMANASSDNNMVSQILDLLTKPASGIHEKDRQKAKSLVALTLIFVPLALIVVIAPPLQSMLSGQGDSTLTIGGVIGVSIAIFAHIISRTKYFQLGAYLTVFAPFAAFLGSLSDATMQETSLFFLALSIVLSSLLLSSRATLISGFLCIAMSIILYITGDIAETPTGAITFILVTMGVLSLTSRIREQNLDALLAAQKELEHRIIETEESRAKAERSDQVKSAFLASMSHELRTPLNAIINFTRFVVKGTLGPVTEQQVETLDNVIISGKHLLNLINDVLDMSKIESDSLNLFVSDDVDVAAILEAVVTTGGALLTDKSVNIEMQIEAGLPLMRGDQQRIHQVFLNIVSNACKFTEEGSINIHAKQDNDDIVIAIRDTGPGIAKEDIGSVFEAFKQTTTGLRQGGGTGLGMPISKSLVEAHSGTLHVSSVVGEGSIFTVRLPIRSNTLVPTLVTGV